MFHVQRSTLRSLLPLLQNQGRLCLCLPGPFLQILLCKLMFLPAVDFWSAYLTYLPTSIQLALLSPGGYCS